jgi:predicted RNA-binding protein with RPS1 domain
MEGAKFFQKEEVVVVGVASASERGKLHLSFQKSKSKCAKKLEKPINRNEFTDP